MVLEREQRELDHVLLTDDQLAQLGNDGVVSDLQTPSELEIVGGFQLAWQGGGSQWMTCAEEK